VLADERFKLADEFCVAAEREVGLEPPLECAETELLQAESLALCRRRVSEVSERRSAPEAERVAEESCRVLRRCGLRVVDKPFEPQQVELVGPDAD
jgi:hypothetical protein